MSRVLYAVYCLMFIVVVCWFCLLLLIAAVCLLLLAVVGCCCMLSAVVRCWLCVVGACVFVYRFLLLFGVADLCYQWCGLMSCFDVVGVVCCCC